MVYGFTVVFRTSSTFVLVPAFVRYVLTLLYTLSNGLCHVLFHSFLTLFSILFNVLSHHAHDYIFAIGTLMNSILETC